MLGGNQLGAVREHAYPIESVLGYRWPDLSAGALRRGRVDDGEAIAALVRRLAHHAIVDADGADARSFLDSVDEAAQRGHLADPRYRYLLASRGATLAGLIALRDASHLFHLFVAPEFQRQGIATRLWRAARADAAASGPAGEFTVNSSLFARPVYERFGFVATGDPVTQHGIRFVPMRLAAPG